MPRVILFNKPYGVLSQFTPEGQYQGLSDYLDCPGFYAAGRLDATSEGLLVLTDDGTLQARISSPKYKFWKCYWAQVEGDVQESDLQALRKGVTLNDGPTLPADCRLLYDPPIGPRNPPIRFRANIPTTWIELRIREGRNRQVRRMTAAIGFPTLRLVRVAVGDWTLDGLEPGQFRLLELNPGQVQKLGVNSEAPPLRPAP